jgi:hypothetical protein
MVSKLNTGVSAVEQARIEMAKETNKDAVIALKLVMRSIAHSKKILANYERELADLEARVEDGSFISTP